MIDEIVRKIYEEDQKAAEVRLAKQKATADYIEEFLRKREEWKEHERQMMEEENRRILEFSQQQQNREEGRMEEKRLLEEAKSKVQQKLSEAIAEKQQADEEMDRFVSWYLGTLYLT